MDSLFVHYRKHKFNFCEQPFCWWVSRDAHLLLIHKTTNRAIKRWFVWAPFCRITRENQRRKLLLLLLVLLLAWGRGSVKAQNLRPTFSSKSADWGGGEDQPQKRRRKLLLFAATVQSQHITRGHANMSLEF